MPTRGRYEDGGISPNQRRCDSLSRKVITKEELEVQMKHFNDRLGSFQERLEELNTELGELFDDLGTTLRPIIRDYYGMDNDSSEDTMIYKGDAKE